MNTAREIQEAIRVFRRQRATNCSFARHAAEFLNSKVPLLLIGSALISMMLYSVAGKLRQVR
jgi:hypothetical protein